MIRTCQNKDINRVCIIINEAAKAYDGHIPADCYQEPYMPLKELLQEFKRLTFFGWEESGKLVGVIGLERIKDMTLLRHAYILKEWQGQGIGGKFLEHIIAHTKTPRLLVGTWADATWAVDFYKTRGFILVPDKDRLLKKYWDISQRQIETSVVLEKTIGS